MTIAGFAEQQRAPLFYACRSKICAQEYSFERVHLFTKVCLAITKILLVYGQKTLFPITVAVESSRYGNYGSVFIAISAVLFGRGKKALSLK